MAEQKKRGRGRPKKNAETKSKKASPAEVESTSTEPVDTEQTDYVEEPTDIVDESASNQDVIEDVEPQDFSDDVPFNDDFNPLEESVIEREYTTSTVQDSNYAHDEQIPEPTFAPQTDDPEFGASGVSEELHQNTGGYRDNAEPSGGVGSDYEEEVVTEIPDDDSVGGEAGYESMEGESSSTNPELQDMSPREKRKAAEKTADAILESYGRLMPILPKKLSSFDVEKLKRMEMDDALSMNMVVQQDGTTVMDYVEDVNQQVEQTFVITDEMKEEIKDPLVDVLLENELALTPTQRLLIAVGGQVLTMGIATYQFNQNNKHALETFKKFHADLKQQNRRRPQPQPQPQAQPQPQPQPQPQQQPQPQSETPPSEGAPISMNDYINDDIPDEPQEEILTEENGGITVEEEPQE